MQFEKICILGLGYIGLPSASTFATHGLQVVGVDVDQRVVSGLKNGEVHLFEPGLRTLVQAAIKSGKLTISSQPEEADAFIIAVPTPFLEDKRADMRFVISATEAIVPVLRRGNLVVLESTSPPRTTVDLVAPILERSGLKAGEDFFLAYSPERVLPGQILKELIENARVIGGIDAASAEAGRDLYRVFVRGDIVLTDSTTAEMVKIMENTYRDVNIAIANEFSRLADRFGVDVWEAIEIANRHPRVNILRPGPGVGGHCISVDPWFLVEAAPDLTPLIRTAREVNDSQPHFVLKLAQKLLGGNLSGRTVAVLGLTYKPDVDDFRESPAVEAALLLQAAGARVRAHDPFQPKQPIDGLDLCDLDEALRGADALVVLVAHSEYRQLNPQALAAKTTARSVLDAVHIFDESAWREAGFNLQRLGRAF
ncbi:UDP-N-acetyl-D-mannosamine dehydrogenase [Ornatilinea apprima]|uniref:UDP-N-acetyl-D-mannosamine dehydrogenase n=1 Tax=Ornatilinea apprima TaxID=1134406 RepID=A0A0P6XBD8_9CHLR|nr:nucleotide sugar dehydrogenase [Ornatilinea apprima]KPL80054.1 UDP-N-acetyl-D-mannosamine dehydrogenase [Ornatilinea apprima]